MTKKGFTLVELIAAIAIIALLIVLVVPGISESSKKAKYKSYLTKLESVRSAAVTYGQDHYKKIIEEGKDEQDSEGENYKVYEMQFKELIPEYLVADRKEPNPNTGGVFEDPRNTMTTLDEYIVKIKINTKTRKVTADIDENQRP